MNPGGNILVCFAVGEEAAPFRKFATNLPEVNILVTGMGKQNAERSLRASLRNHRSALVLSCGFAGGLDPQLTRGTVVFDAGDHPRLEAELQKAGARRARFYCADRVAATAAEKRALRESTRADAVEMESGVMRAVCAEQKIAFATVRVILDPADEDLPLDFNRLLTPDQRMNYGRLAVVLAKAPGKIAGLRRLQRQSKIAAQTLARTLAGVAAGLPAGEQRDGRSALS